MNTKKGRIRLNVNKVLFIAGKNGKNDPLKTVESDHLKLHLPNIKKLSSGLGSKRNKIQPELNFVFYLFTQIIGPQILQKYI